MIQIRMGQFIIHLRSPNAHGSDAQGARSLGNLGGLWTQGSGIGSQ